MKEIRDFEKWYKEVNCSKEKIEMIKFTAELLRTPYTEYYYSIMINKNTNKFLKDTLWQRFYDHKDADIFLLNKLENKLDTEFHGEIIYCLGKIIDQKNNNQKTTVLEYTKEFTNNSNENTREKAVIILGWIGGNEEIDLLGNILLNDTHNKCRAWASTSFMQMSFRRKINLEKVLPYLYKSIKQEQDSFVNECIIDTLQELTKKKFGLRKKDLDTDNTEAINNSKIKVIKYFEK